MPGSSNGVCEEGGHPFREEWVIVATHRLDRPWSGETVPHEQQTLPTDIDDCYPGPVDARISGTANQKYDGVFVFDNDHPSVGVNAPNKLPRQAFIKIGQLAESQELFAKSTVEDQGQMFQMIND